MSFFKFTVKWNKNLGILFETLTKVDGADFATSIAKANGYKQESTSLTVIPTAMLFNLKLNYFD